MAKTIATPEFSNSLPLSGKNLLLGMTTEVIWKDETIQYFFADNTALSLDAQFVSDYNGVFSGATPDATFFFGAMTVRAFKMIDSVITTDFAKTTDINKADEVLVSAPENTNIEGFSTFPGTNEHEGQAGEYWSFTALNSQVAQMVATAEVGGGEYANWTVIHEIGHSLGLYHPFQYPASQHIANMDNERYTVMSYDGASGPYNYGHAVTMMALDIAGLQQLYGAEKYANGKSTYTLFNAQGGELDLTESSVEIGRAYCCIWDSGGTDTVKYGNTGKSVLINLNAATLDTSQAAASVADVIAALQNSAFFQALSAPLQLEITDPGRHAGGFFSRVLEFNGSTYSGIDGGYSIANGAKIENAVGGDQADLLIGNAFANRIEGLVGADTLFGSGGNDRLLGGAGADGLTGGTGKDRFEFGALTASIQGAADTILDFAAGDLFDVSAIDALAKKGDQAFKFIGDADFSGKKGVLHFFQQDDNTIVEIDKNGDMVADMQFMIAGLFDLRKADFDL